MNRSDYTKFSLEQLENALQQLDAKQYPEDTKIISALIQAEKIHSQQKPDNYSLTKTRSLWIHLVTASLLFSLALYIQLTSKIPVLNIPLNSEGVGFVKLALVLACCGSGVISLFHFIQEYLKTKNNS
jgi:hypothetical protein